MKGISKIYRIAAREMGRKDYYYNQKGKINKILQLKQYVAGLRKGDFKMGTTPEELTQLEDRITQLEAELQVATSMANNSFNKGYAAGCKAQATIDNEKYIEPLKDELLDVRKELEAFVELRKKYIEQIALLKEQLRLRNLIKDAEELTNEKSI